MSKFVRLTAAAAAFSVLSAPAFAQAVEPALAAEPALASEPAVAIVSEAPASDPMLTVQAGPRVAYTVRSTPPAFVMTKASNGALAMIGAMAAVAEGKRLAVEHGLEEPANALGAEIAAAFAASKGGEMADAPIAIVEKKTDLLAGNTIKADYIVDVAPVSMNAIYFPTDWTHYGLIYVSNVRVLNGADGKMVAKAKCFVKPQKTPESPNYDALMDDNAAGLKAMIAEAGKSCAAQLRDGLKV